LDLGKAPDPLYEAEKRLCRSRCVKAQVRKTDLGAILRVEIAAPPKHSLRLLRELGIHVIRPSSLIKVSCGQEAHFVRVTPMGSVSILDHTKSAIRAEAALSVLGARSFACFQVFEAITRRLSGSSLREECAIADVSRLTKRTGVDISSLLRQLGDAADLIRQQRRMHKTTSDAWERRRRRAEDALKGILMQPGGVLNRMLRKHGGYPHVSVELTFGARASASTCAPAQPNPTWVHYDIVVDPRWLVWQRREEHLVKTTAGELPVIGLAPDGAKVVLVEGLALRLEAKTLMKGEEECAAMA